MIIGLTGGIGSGKSAAGNIFRQHGITVIDADQASREVFEKDPKAKSADLNVARQFLRDNGIDAVPTEDNPLGKLLEELPFDEKRKNPVKTN